ncbi:L-ascorbate peroxidase 3, peroxisomal [Porphyridium purpureum]|uniref:L-ascorbate peroxidase 3, peroxisomal n=1 Tax=Porphyridium purpureum TaxID=35688 RepID=A0A5J4YXF4_PORPP|nr:L-ascorbate peroxidase 3, peroxisomal [Porphyridium purpureum]|eukprot:POR5669..scf209_3
METGIREALDALFKETPCMPLIVRLAWHDAGTYDVKTNTGGPNASIRFDPEIMHGANAGLKKGIDLLEPIKEKFPECSFADFYQLASIHAIKFAGGPDIPFRFGRKDADGSAVCTEDGRLPDATKRLPHLRDVFYRMGLGDKEIVVLSGAHCLGMPHKDRSGFDTKPWTETPLKFSNTYFVEILKPEANEQLTRLVSDMALLDEEGTKSLCEAYAKDEDLFFKDYSEAHVKLSELGVAF